MLTNVMGERMEDNHLLFRGMTEEEGNTRFPVYHYHYETDKGYATITAELFLNHTPFKGCVSYELPQGVNPKEWSSLKYKRLLLKTCKEFKKEIQKLNEKAEIDVAHHNGYNPNILKLMMENRREEKEKRRQQARKEKEEQNYMKLQTWIKENKGKVQYFSVYQLQDNLNISKNEAYISISQAYHDKLIGETFFQGESFYYIK